MFRFASPQLLYLLIVPLAMIVLYIIAMRARRKRIERFGDMNTISQLMPDASPQRVRNKFILYLCAMVMIVAALARPQFGSKLKEVSREGIEIMLAVDVSNSMLAQDFEPNRLERTKYAISRLLEGLTQDQVGLVVFAGDAYVQLPITSDYVAARNFVSQVSPNMVSKQGTDMGAAISLAASSFSSESEGSRVMIIISDGENHESDAVAAAEAAAQAGIKIYTIGIGTPEGAPIEINGEFLKDDKGEMVVTKLDEEGLQNIALTTGGAYIRSTNQSLGLQEIIAKVNETQKKQFSSMVFEEFNEQYQYLLGMALIFLLLDMLMISRKNRILARFNIFNRQK